MVVSAFTLLATALAVGWGLQPVIGGNRHRGDIPGPDGHERVVTTLSAEAHLQVSRLKPKSIDKIETRLRDILVAQTSVTLMWTFMVMVKTDRVRRDSEDPMDAYVQIIRPLEWIVRVRRFGSLFVDVNHVRDEVNLKDNKTYSFQVNDLKQGTAYEICIQSKDYPIVDDAKGITSRPQVNQELPPFARRFVLCKEVVTKPQIQPKPQISTRQAVVASAVSSASTVVVVAIVCCCCCPRKRKKETNNRRKRYTTYEKVAYYFSPKNSSSAASGSLSEKATSSKIIANHPLVPQHRQEEYVNPQDILSISGKKVRVFVREKKKHNIPMTWSKFPIYQPNHTHPHLLHQLQRSYSWPQGRLEPPSVSPSTAFRSSASWLHIHSDEAVCV